jgi:tRNA (guanine37-N1)-methyltransferase
MNNKKQSKNSNGMKQFSVISLFPEMLESYLSTSIMGRAQGEKLMRVNLIPLRTFTAGKHRTADDSPYGGGPGMVLKPEPIWKAVEAAKKKVKKGETRVILFSTRGKALDQAMVRRLSKYDHLIFICGRYEGVDERVAEHLADEEVSLGNFVLSGGELPALCVIDAVTRQIPGALGKFESLEDIKGSYPVYTKPALFEGKTKKGKMKKMKVPEVLLSGNHKLIEEWRKKSV